MADRKRLLSPEGAKARARRAPLSCRAAQRSMVRLTVRAGRVVHDVAWRNGLQHPPATGRSIAARPPITGSRGLMGGSCTSRSDWGASKRRQDMSWNPNDFCECKACLTGPASAARRSTGKSATAAFPVSFSSHADASHGAVGGSELDGRAVQRAGGQCRRSAAKLSTAAFKTGSCATSGCGVMPPMHA